MLWLKGCWSSRSPGCCDARAVGPATRRTRRGRLVLPLLSRLSPLSKLLAGESLPPLAPLLPAPPVPSSCRQAGGRGGPGRDGEQRQGLGIRAWGEGRAMGSSTAQWAAARPSPHRTSDPPSLLLLPPLLLLSSAADELSTLLLSGALCSYCFWLQCGQIWEGGQADRSQRCAAGEELCCTRHCPPASFHPLLSHAPLLPA